jgi:uncharacterized protein YndB with AHSA1/START domain
MATIEKTMITVTTTVDAPVEKVWTLWTDPKHIVHWNNASDDWHTPRAENDLKVGGKFLSRMEAKDGSEGFDFSGVYNKVVLNKQIFYTIEGGREVRISFSSERNKTAITETFEAENIYPPEFQKSGWQSILDNFKKYAEAYGKAKPIHYEITINASPERVYQTTIGDKSYSEWTSEFNPTSHFIGSWKKGSKILFLGSDNNGGEGGMVSRIKENIPNKFISIEHLGLVQNGEEITSGTEAEIWAGATENYSFIGENEKTLFSVDMESKHEISEEFKSYFAQTWPKALKKLKTICES